MNKLCLLLLSVGLAPAFAAPRDGARDFDFALGTWTSHVRRLQKPLTGSTTWTDNTGTVSVRKLWETGAQMEEIELDNPTTHVEALTLRLYDPKAHQWRLHWSNAKRGTVAAPPSVGEFKGGRGEFYDQEDWDGKPILVRHIYSDIQPNSYHFEQAFSADNGKTWEANWVAEVTRAESIAKPPAAPEPNHELDFNLGKWKTHVSKLSAPLSGSKQWLEYDGTSEVTPVWNGRASLLQMRVQGPAGTIEGAGLRLYDPTAHRWSLNWVSRRDGLLGVPMFGGFENGRGEFVDVEPFNGRQIFVRNTFSEITPRSCRFEQAFSDDGGRTWETNWVMTFERGDDA